MISYCKRVFSLHLILKYEKLKETSGLWVKNVFQLYVQVSEEKKIIADSRGIVLNAKLNTLPSKIYSGAWATDSFLWTFCDFEQGKYFLSMNLWLICWAHFVLYSHPFLHTHYNYKLIPLENWSHSSTSWNLQRSFLIVALGICLFFCIPESKLR